MSEKRIECQPRAIPYPGPHVTRMEVLFYKFVEFIFETLQAIIHFVVAIKFWRKGESVPPVNNPLLLKSATKLAEEIRAGELRSEVVVRAYINRIRTVDPYVNATVNRCFEQALKEAMEADSLIASGRYTKEQLAKEKPLLGVPLTVKTFLRVKGLRATAGFKSFKNWRSPDDAPCVALMKEAGAIIIATTNVPELAMNVETFNKLHGVTRNPYDINRTCGGTSGGEVALIASGGSILGLGNDILGSLRLPAHFAGVFTHMPTRGLVSNNGSFPPGKISCPAELDGCEKMPFLTVGPISRYAEDLIISMRILSSQNEVWKTFGQQVDFKKLKIRYLTEIETYVTKPVDKEITDSLKDAVSYFEKRYGIKGEEIKMPSLYHSVKCLMNNLLLLLKDDGVERLFTGGKGLDFNIKMDLIKFLCGRSNLCFPSLFVFNLSHCPLWYRESSLQYYQELVEQWKEEFDSLLDEDTILLLPTSPFTAPYHYEMVFLFPNACYTSVLNLVGLPATHCPMGLSKQGMPYGIQIVGRKNNDNLTIACAIELEKAFGGWKSPGKT